MCGAESHPWAGVDWKKGIDDRKLAIDLIKISENDYVGFRDEELDKINQFLTKCLRTNSGGSLFVFGLSGTGKTTTLLHALREFQRENRSVTTVTLRGSTFISLKSFKEQFFHQVLNYSKAKVRGILNQSSNGRVQDYAKFRELVAEHFGKSNKLRICLIDEVDYLSTFCSNLRGYHSSNWLLQSLFKAASGPRSRVAIVAISNNLHFSSKIKENSCLKVLFKPYREGQMVSIMLGKMRALELEGLVDRTSLLLLARRVANTSGDCRAYLDSFLRALSNSLNSLEKDCCLSEGPTTGGSSSSVEEGTPRRTFNGSGHGVGVREIGVVTPSLSLSKMDQLRQKLAGLPVFQLILLLAICRANFLGGPIDSNSVKKYFLELCERLRMDGRDAESFCNAEFGNSVEQFRQLGVVSKGDLVVRTDAEGLARVVLEGSALDLEMVDLWDESSSLTKRYSHLVPSLNLAATTTSTTTITTTTTTNSTTNSTTTNSSTTRGGKGARGRGRRLWWCR